MLCSIKIGPVESDQCRRHAMLSFDTPGKERANADPLDIMSALEPDAWNARLALINFVWQLPNLPRP